MSVLLAVVGLLIGSHVAVVVMRWPDHASAAFARSRCDGCGRGLTPRELMPLLSLVLQRGRCRACSAPIAALHWQAEVGGLAIGLAAGLVADPPVALAGAVFGWLLLALALLDATRFLLPDVLNAALAITGVLAMVLGVGVSPEDCAIGAIAGYASLAAVRHVYWAVRGREGLGGGDPKLLGAVGCWLGWQPLAVLVLTAAMLGLAFVLAQRLRGRRFTADQRLPLGTMLAGAAFCVWLGMHGRWPVQTIAV